MSESTDTHGHIWWQRSENLIIFAVATFMFYLAGGSVLMYFVLLLSFDVFMIGYLFGKTIGAFLYNLGHSYILPIGVTLAGYSQEVELLTQLGLLWVAHIGMDRAFGYGLKLKHGFEHTHLGKIGRDG